MGDTIICMAEQEPAGFHVNAAAASIRLAFEVAGKVVPADSDQDRAKKEQEAGAAFGKFLAGLKDVHFKAYKIGQNTIDAYAASITEPPAFDAPTSSRLFDWLSARSAEAMKANDKKAFFAAPAPGSSNVIESQVGATETMFGASTWTAPLPHKLGLAHVVRIKPDVQEALPDLLIVPYFGSATLGNSYSVTKQTDPESGESTYEFKYNPYDGTDSGVEVTCRSSRVVPIAPDTTSLIDNDSGFLYGDPEGENIHRAIVRVEQRGGSQLATFPAVLHMAWPWKDDRSDKPEPIDDLRFFRRMVWRAVTALVVALDPILIALRTPGNNRREGPLLSALFDQLTGVLGKEVDAYNKHNPDHPLEVPDNAALLAVLRGAIAALPLYSDGDPPASWSETLKFVFELDETTSEPGQTPLLMTLLKNLYASEPDQNKTIGELRAVFAKPTQTTADPPQPIPLYDLELRDGTLYNRLNAGLGKIADALAGEGPIERLITRVLQCRGQAGSFDQRITQGLKTLLPPLVPGNPTDVNSQKLAADVRAAFEKVLAGQFNGAEAVRQACGVIYVDALLRKKWPDKVSDLEQLLVKSDLFHDRLLANDLSGNPLGEVLKILTNPARNLIDGADLDRWTTPMFADVVAELFAEKPANRFVPTAAPLPLPLQITVDQSTASLDTFNSQFGGVGLLIRRIDQVAEKGLDQGWAYTSLAELTLTKTKPAQAPDIPMALEPLLPGEIDGRRQLFLEYAGLPFTTAAFADTLPATQSAKGDAAPFYTMDFPATPLPKTLPRLAYGREFDVVGHVVSKGGVLPYPLQKSDDAPWLPKATIDLSHVTGSQGSRTLLQNFRHCRTTSIGRTLIRETEKSASLIGASIENTRPLSVDYPRIGFASESSASRFLDIMRNSDGSGSIAIPPKDMSASLKIKDILLWGEDHELVLGFHRMPTALADDKPLTSVTLSSGSKRVIDDLDIVLSEAERDSDKPDAVILNFRLAVLVDGTKVLDQVVSYGFATRSIWLRLSLEAASSSCAVSLADPASEMRGSAVASRPMPENLLLIGNGAKEMQHNGPILADLVFPRVGLLDFERWLNNDDLRSKTYGGHDKLVEEFRIALSAAYSVRLVNSRLAMLLDRLPDLAVAGLRLELTPLDSLRGAPADEAQSGPLWAGQRVLDIPARLLGDRLYDAASGIPGVDRQTGKGVVGAIGELLEKLNDGFSRRISISCSGKALSITESSGVIQIRIPEGVCARLTARPLVNAGYFAEQDDHPPVIDPRLLQYSAGSLVDNPGAVGELRTQYELFDGATLNLEAMVGPIVIAADDSERPWLAVLHKRDKNNKKERNDWADIVAEAFQHRAIGTSRAYDVCLAPQNLKKPWQWRQLAYVDIQTQRWRFTGRPIYNWIEARKPKVTGAFSKPLEEGHDEPSFPGQLAAFESEAFADRADIDAEVNTVTLLPVPAVSTILNTIWEKPSATLFRHRFVVRSRYAGAMADPGHRETNAWRDTTDDGPANWFRIAMLADRSRLQLTRPQLRALIPLTSAPNEPGTIGPSPPVLAVLQEHPFEHGGLADRISAEIRTGFSYAFSPAPSGKPEDARVDPHDARKEVGPSPAVTYQSLPQADALALVLPAEGPVGLTFDSDAVAAPAFPNAMYVLQPSSLKESLKPVPSDMEEHFLSVALRRYLDTEWLRPEAPPEQPSTTGAASAIPPAAIPLDQCCWITLQANGAGRLTLKPGFGKAIEICSFKLEHGFVSGFVAARAIDSTVADDAQVKELELFRIAESGRQFALLHVPLEEKRFSLSIFALPSDRADYARQLSGSGNRPLPLASFDWSLPKQPHQNPYGTKPDKALDPELSCSGVESISLTSASALTSMNWTRINRDFDRVHIAYAYGQSAIPVSNLVLDRDDDTLTIGAVVDGKINPDVWIRPKQWIEPAPLEMQRHVALLETWRDERFGSPVEEFKSLRRLRGKKGLSIGDKPPDGVSHLVRVVEFETPARIIGYLPDAAAAAAVPVTNRGGFFDFRALGIEPPPAKGPSISLFMRLITSSMTRSGFKKLTLQIGMNASNKTLLDFERKGSPGNVMGFLLGMTNTAENEWTTTTSIMFDDGTVSEPQAKKLSGDAFKDPDGLRLSIAGLDDGKKAEGWLEVSMLADAADPDSVNFDWFFTGKPSAPGDAVRPAALSKMIEAQARIIAISPPAVVSGAGLGS
ncbi:MULTISPECIES: hypothetical protein [unclassified Bradyrhizobium]|uniref:hypothetical protein n=1 Tax=unclassified Bradyrhizobium TaxID=2631580 RepID=UPI0028EFD7A7|nr:MULTISPECIES: hypothetical protein [unclassified Bradyrhizobium]